MQFGGSIQGNSNGWVGIDQSFRNVGASDVSVKYPVLVGVTAPKTVIPGGVARIGTNWALQPGWEMSARSPSTVGVETYASFDVDGGADGNVCVFRCTGYTLVPSFDGLGLDVPILAAGLPPVPGHPPMMRFEELSLQPGLLGFTGQVGFPLVDPSNVSTNGRNLVATGERSFLSMAADISKLIGRVTGKSWLFGLQSPQIGQFQVGYTALNLKAQTNGRQSQTMEFAPGSVMVHLQFPPAPTLPQYPAGIPVPPGLAIIYANTDESGLPRFPQGFPYTVRNGSGAVQGSGIGTSVDIPAGWTVDVVIPQTFSGDFEVTPSFSLPNSFSNRTVTRYTSDLSFKVLALRVHVPGFQLTPGG